MINDGNIAIAEAIYADGTNLMYECDDMFSTRNPTITTCQAAESFTWSLDMDPPTCLRSMST